MVAQNPKHGHKTTPRQETRRYLVTASDIVQKLGLDPHPELRGSGPRRILRDANEALFLASSGPSEASVAQVMGGEIRKVCHILGNMALRLRMAPEAPVEAHLSALHANVHDLKDSMGHQIVAKTRTLSPPTIELMANINRTLSDMYGIPANALPGARHWMGLYSKLNKGALTASVPLQAAAHVGLPVTVPPVLGVYDTPDYTLTASLAYKPGGPFRLHAGVTWHKTSRTGELYKPWDPPVICRMTTLNDLEMVNTQAWLREGLEGSDPRFEVLVRVGQPGGDLSAAPMLNLEVLQTIDVNFPAKEDPLYGQYVVGLGRTVSQTLGSRESITDRARDLADAYGLQFLDLQMVQTYTKMVYVCGFSVWWSGATSSTVNQALISALRNFIAGTGGTGTAPQYSSGVFLMRQEAADIAVRAKMILDDPNLAMPKSTRNALVLLINAIDRGELVNQESMTVTIPAKLDFIEKYHRRASTEPSSPARWRAAFKAACPHLAAYIRTAHGMAVQTGVPRRGLINPKEVLERLAFQARTDIDVYQRIPNQLTIRIPHTDFSVADRVVGHFFHPTCTAKVTNIQGTLEYEVYIP